MVVANLPAKVIQNALPEELVDSLSARIAAGQHPRDIARQLHPEDRRARHRTYKRLRRIALRDARVAQYVAEEAKLNLLVALGQGSLALGRRARTGRPDAIKLLFEASGFHNPRVSHEHSGEVTVKIKGVPRPKFVENEDEPVDAEVVDES